MGPGDYNTSKDILHGKNVTKFGTSSRESSIEQKPGPGQYDSRFNFIKPSIPGCDIGKGNDGK